MDRGLPSLRVRLLVEEAQPVSVVTPVMEQVVSVRVCTRTETETVAQIRNGFVTEQRQTGGVPGQIRSGFVTAQCEKGVATGQIRNGFVTEQDQKGTEPGQIRSGFVAEHRQKGFVPGQIRNATEQDQKGAVQGQIQSGFAKRESYQVRSGGELLQSNVEGENDKLLHLNDDPNLTCKVSFQS
jgi:hypothetical protein